MVGVDRARGHGLSRAEESKTREGAVCYQSGLPLSTSHISSFLQHTASDLKAGCPADTVATKYCHYLYIVIIDTIPQIPDT